MARASKIMAPTSCFSGQVHYLPDAPEAYGAKITRAKAAPSQSRSADPTYQHLSTLSHHLVLKVKIPPCTIRLGK